MNDLILASVVLACVFLISFMVFVIGGIMGENNIYKAAVDNGAGRWVIDPGGKNKRFAWNKSVGDGEK